jgi:hypothetical protein
LYHCPCISAWLSVLEKRVKRLVEAVELLELFVGDVPIYKLLGLIAGLYLQLVAKGDNIPLVFGATSEKFQGQDIVLGWKEDLKFAIAAP